MVLVNDGGSFGKWLLKGWPIEVNYVNNEPGKIWQGLLFKKDTALGCYKSYSDTMLNVDLYTA